MLVLNLVCRDTALKKNVCSDLKSVFPSIVSFAVPQEVNDILYCSKENNLKWNIEPKFRDLNNFFKIRFKTADVFLHFTDIIKKISYI